MNVASFTSKIESSIEFVNSLAHMKTFFCPLCESSVSASSCESIAEVRRKLQQVSKKCVLVLDETQMRVNEAATSTLVLPGNSQFVMASATDAYAARFDMIACIHYHGVFSPVIFSPTARQERGVDGINSAMLIEYIAETLAPEVAALGLKNPVLMLDRASIHSEKRITKAFSECGVQLKEVIKIPTQSAKRLSPLDNSLFHDWKEKVRKSCPLTEETSSHR
jgi:hypothetical protein